MKKFKKIVLCTAVCAVVMLCSVLCSALELTPGLNILTGTEQPFDFEGDVSNVVFSSEATETENAVVTYATSSNANNKAAALGKGKKYFYFKDFPTIEMERPVNYSFDYVYGGQLRVTLNGDTTGYYSLLNKFISNGTTTKWASTPYKSLSRKSIDGLTNGGDLRYEGNEDVTDLYFMNYSNSASTSYFDNISIVPAYKLSYDLKGGIGFAQDVYTFDSQYSTLVSSSDVAKPGHTFKGWSVKEDGSEIVTSITFTPGQDTTLYAVWEQDTSSNKKLVQLYDNDTLRSFKWVTAGSALTLPQNEINGDYYLLGWQTEDKSVLYGRRIPAVNEDLVLCAKWHKPETKPGVNVFGDGSFETDNFFVKPSMGVLTVENQDGNNWLKYEKDDKYGQYASIQYPVLWEYQRPYKISYKFKAPYAAGININAIYSEAYVDDNGEDAVKTTHLFGQSNVKANSLYTYSDTYTFNYSDFVRGDSDAISLYYNPSSDGISGTVYYDDLEFVPYYKVTYVAEGASGVPESEYFLSDKYTVSSSIPTKPKSIFAGWSLSESSVSAVTEVTPVKGQDIILYAIWESVDAHNAISYSYKNTVPGTADGTIVVNCTEETADYAGVEVYLADNEGILEEYTPFATMDIIEQSASYAVSGNRIFAENATRLAFVFKAEDKDDVTYWYTIPAEHRFSKTGHSLKFKFFATSDSHLGGSSYNSDYWPAMTVNRKNAMKDIFASDVDFMFINGDVVNYGPEIYVNVLKSYLTDVLNNKNHNINGIPVFLTTGNHEYTNSGNVNGGFDFELIQSEVLGQLDYISENHPDIKITRDGDNLWYAADIEGAKFIFLSTPEEKAEGDKHTYTVSAKQLAFLISSFMKENSQIKPPLLFHMCP